MSNRRQFITLIAAAASALHRSGDDGEDRASSAATDNLTHDRPEIAAGRMLCTATIRYRKAP